VPQLDLYCSTQFRNPCRHGVGVLGPLGARDSLDRCQQVGSRGPGAQQFQRAGAQLLKAAREALATEQMVPPPDIESMKLKELARTVRSIGITLLTGPTQTSNTSGSSSAFRNTTRPPKGVDRRPQEAPTAIGPCGSWWATSRRERRRQSSATTATVRRWTS
jgi:hypothetical protein